MPDCLVCGADNAKQHYGSWCCNGCKGFFWRSISSKRRYVCLNRGSDLECKLQDGRRNCCRACRLKRCLEVGMDPNLIRDCWGKSTSNGIQQIRDRAGSLGEQDKANSDISRPESFSSASEIQKKPLMPIMTPYHHDHQPTKAISSSNLQLLSDYLEWVQGIPEMKLLSEDDKNVMVLCRARPAAWLLLAQQHQTNENRGQIDMAKKELLQHEIVGPLKELDVHCVEFELLKNICFFSTVPSLSSEGRRTVMCVQNAYVKALSEFALRRIGQQRIEQQNGGTTESSLLLNSVFRLNRIMHILTAVEKIAHLQD